MNAPKDRMILVSNRLPVSIENNGDGFYVTPSSGGLVTALRPLLQQSAGAWVGWTGTDDSHEVTAVLRDYSKRSNFALEPIFMSAEERLRFYFGFQ